MRLLSVTALLFTALAAHAADLADLTIRYVNNEVITMGDVQLRNDMRRSDYQRKGLVLPRTNAEFIAFSNRSLDDLTDDVLLAQKAKEMGIEANHDEITLEVLQNARRSGVGLSLRDQAEQRRHLERQRTIDRITGYYESLAPMPRPADLLKIYSADTTSFNRPSQARLLQILIRPSPPEERQQLRTAKAALLRRAQEAVDPALKAIVDARLADYLAADAAGQDAALDQLVNQLAAQVERKDLKEGDLAILQEVKTLADRQAALISADDVRTRLETARLSLAGLRGEGLVQAFRELAKRISQGPAAARGGEIGWVEPGAYTPEFDAVAFALQTGDLSQPFRIGDTGCLVLCAERKEALTRSFDEVSGEIERSLRWQQREKARKQAVVILRGKASIRDVNTLDQLVR